MDLKDNESAVLVAQGEALSTLVRELKLIPAFKVVLQNCLEKAVFKLAPRALISSVYINVLQGASQSGGEPTGRILDVFLECLQRGKVPRYPSAIYAVYEFPGSDPQDIISEISIAALEGILNDLLNNFSNDYISELKKYFEVVGGRPSNGSYPKVSRQAALSVLQASLFSRELDSMVAQGVLTEEEGTHVGATAQAGLTGACYGIYIEGRNGKYVEQNAMFAVPLNNPVHEQLIPGSDGAFVLYSPSRGVERFTSSLKLQQALVTRLASPDTQQEFLQTLPVNEQDGFAYGPDIRFLKVHDNLFDRYTQQTLRKAYSDVGYHLDRLNQMDSDLNKISAAVQSTQSLEALPRQAKQRHAQLLKIMARNAWPQWLKKSSDVNQEVYESLQQQLLAAEVNHHEITGGIVSLHDYARICVEDFISPGKDERVNPDNIFVNVVHTVTLADGKKVELRERKSLTQAFMHGSHDDAGQYQIVPEEFSNNPKLTPGNILRAIQTLNIRVNYNAERRAIYSRPEVIESMREVFGRSTALSMFAAFLQNHVPPSAQELVTRYNLGDPSIDTMLVSLRPWANPLNGVLVYRSKGTGAERNVHVIHMPGFPTGQEWFQFADLKSLQHEIARWVFNPQTWVYLKARAYADVIADIDGRYIGDDRRLILQEWWRADITLNRVVAQVPLSGAVMNQIVWDTDQVEVTTPGWFRSAQVADQKLFNRLNYDFKAVYHYSKEQLEIEPFKEFSRKLVQRVLKEYLSRSGPAVDINPDEVWVKFNTSAKITLTELFIQWQHWRSDVSVFTKFFTWLSPVGSLLHAVQEQVRRATFSTDTNQPITRLNAQVINDLIELIPGEHYAKYLKSKFVNASDINLKVNLFRKLKQNEMLRAALVQKMNRSLSQEQFNALKSMIDGLDRDVPGASIGGVSPGMGVYELTLSGRRIEGAYVFSWLVSNRLESMIYIPNASDGKGFFPYHEFGTRLRDVLGMREDILRMTRLEHQVYVKNEMDRWNSPTDLSSPRISNSFKIKSFHEEYAFMIERILADVDHQTTSPAEAFWRDARILAEFALDVASMFIPPLGLIVSVLRITQSVVLGIVAASQGLDAAANAHFASAWRGAIMLYVGKVAAIGAPVNPIALLSSIRDIADVMTAVTGVEVSINYLTAVAAPPSAVDSTTRLLN